MPSNSRSRWSSLVGVLIVAVVVGGSFLGLRYVATSGFDQVEAGHAAQESQRLRIALDYEIALLASYGATNSIWDDSYAAVLDADAAGFAEAFPPSDIREIYRLGGVIGVGRDGTPRVGGLAGEDPTYAPLPDGFATADVLSRLVDTGAEPGSGRCGAVNAAGAAYLYCGFPAFPADSTGNPSGGLIYLKALDKEYFAALSEDLGQRTVLAQDSASGVADAADAAAADIADIVARPAALTLPSELGDVAVRTAVTESDHIDLLVSIPVTVGDPIQVISTSDRPAHRAESATVTKMFVVTALGGSCVIVVLLVASRRAIRRRLRPLRRTAEAVIASGDRTLRIGGADKGEVGALSRVLDSMLDTLEARERDIHEAQQDREQQLRTMFLDRRKAEQQTKVRAQEIIDETATAVLAELKEVVEQAGAVKARAVGIDERVVAADGLTAAVVNQADAADHVLNSLGESLRKVAGIADMINGVARQTGLLALNATIEAVRAGETGLGFGVVATEVKELASTSATATDDIRATIEGLERDAAAVAQAITGMVTGISEVADTSSTVTSLVAEQRTMVDQLDVRVRDAMERIDAMAKLTEKLERRKDERVTVTGLATLVTGSREVEVDVLDLSHGGMRCQLRPGTSISEGPVTFRWPVGQDAVAGRASVLRVFERDGNTQLSLQFDGLEPEAQRLVDARLGALIG